MQLLQTLERAADFYIPEGAEADLEVLAEAFSAPRRGGAAVSRGEGGAAVTTTTTTTKSV